jgi:DNA invertase Pin-like site-specific DNA recombinase
MARTPGRQTNEPDDNSPILQVDELNLYDVGRTIQELAAQLRGVADLIDNGEIRRSYQEAERIGAAEAFEVADELATERFERTLTGLRSFRRNYDYWERVIAEYSLAKQGMTQREVARLLGVSTATINRWAQHPVAIEPKR